MIVAIAQNRAIGKDNKMLWHLPEDFKYFKKTTMGCPIIMGRKTFESIGKPLPGRKSVIITRNKDYSYEGCVVVNSLEEALKSVSDSKEVFIIGGGSIYQQALRLVGKIHITNVYHEFDADTFFPELPIDFKEVSREKHYSDEKHKYDYDFVVYERL